MSSSDIAELLQGVGFKVRSVEGDGDLLTVWIDDAPKDPKTYKDRLKRIKAVTVTCYGHGMRLDDAGVWRSYVRVLVS